MPRGKDSIERENMFTALVPAVLMAQGLEAARAERKARRKFVVACTADGKQVDIWVKQAWSEQLDISVIQFREPDSAKPWSNQDFIDKVSSEVAKAKTAGAQYLFMGHMAKGEVLIRDNFVVLDIDDVVPAYRQQMGEWPDFAREGGFPVLNFDDRRGGARSRCASIVRQKGLPIAGIAGLVPPVKGDSPASKTVMAETERRMMQEVFRQRVGDRCGWTCVVSGNQVDKVLDAAHLPGRNWRQHNESTDGILLRADLHRLLDGKMAELREGRFWIHPDARCEQYAGLHNVRYDHS